MQGVEGTEARHTQLPSAPSPPAPRPLFALSLMQTQAGPSQGREGGDGASWS